MYTTQQRRGGRLNGFTLPTVVIASVAMLAMLLLSFQITRSTSTALREQYYGKLASMASEAGATRAVECLDASSGVQEWSSSSPLRANTNCDGSSMSGCPDGPHCYVVYDNEVRTNFQVGDVSMLPSGGYSFSVYSTVDRISPSDGVARTVSDGNVNYTSNTTSKPQIAGGGGWLDRGHIGVFVSTSGELYGYGWNSEGQITNSGLPDIVSTPIKMDLPSGVDSVKMAKTSGRGASYICIIGSDSAVYCRGDGASMLVYRAGWQKMGIPGNLPVIDMVTNGYGGDSVCAKTSNNQVYCFGNNDYGRLGNGTGSYAGELPSVAIGSSRRFALPAGVTVDKLYQTVANTHCVKGSDGTLYCAGSGYVGQPGPTAAEYNPTPMDFRLPNMGIVKRSAEDVRTNYHSMINTHVLATDGSIWSRGQRSQGNMGSGRYNGATLTSVAPDWFGPRGGLVSSRAPGGKCMDVKDGVFSNGQALQFYDCNGTAAQNFFYTADTKSLYIPTNSDSGNAKCVGLAANDPTEGNSIIVWDCTGGASQRWSVDADGTIRHIDSGKCIGPRGGMSSGSALEIQTCSGSDNQTFNLSENAKPYLALISGQDFLCGVKESSARCSGVNGKGQLMNDARSLGGQLDGSVCTGTASTYQLQLPPGETVDVNLLVNGSGQWQYQVDSLQVVTRSGKVYGSGANVYGRLGNDTVSSAQCSVVQMKLPVGVIAVDMSTMDEYSTYVLGNDGNVYAVGRNDKGQLGDGTTTNRSRPSRVLLERQSYFY